MNIRPRDIPKFQGGNNIWYLGLIDYDPTEYLITYDTSRLVNGDMSDTILSPWKSNISGYDVGRYLPTDHGAFGKNKEHYNYTLGVEGLDYYKKFGEDLLDSSGNFTPTGEAWARAVDALLPEGSNASFYDPKTKQLRTKWTTQYRDAHGRSAQTFTNLKDYVNHVRNDLLLGARHNVFLNKGKRYFYIDNLGLKHWVDPSVIDKYNVSKDPSEQGWEGTTYWNDYELTGLKNLLEIPEKEKEVGITPKEKTDTESLWNKLSAGFKNIAPDLLATVRYAGNMHNNERVYNEMKKAIIPNLLETYTTHRQVVGDEATKLAYYRRAAQGESKATKAFTSDADRQMAYIMEAKRVGDELRAQGDLADNQEIRRTSDESSQHQWANTLRANEVANANITELNKAKAAQHQLNAQKYTADWTNTDLYLLGWESKFKLDLNRQKAIEDLIKTLQMQEDLANDPNIKEAYDALDRKAKELFPDNNINWNDSRLNEYIKNLLSARRQAMIKYYTLYAKSGNKITKKDHSDKFLYKTSKDIVEHFRRMSKMTDDSRIRTIPKPIKLSSHPRKMLMGGIAPFTIYRPLGVGTENTALTSVETGSKSSKDTAAKDKLDMIKELFKSVQGLPIDASKVYSLITGLLSKYRAFGEEMSTDDIASMYLSVMNQINHLKYSQDAYNKAHALAVANEALNEIAVGSSGELVLLDKETGEVKRGTLTLLRDSDGKLRALTNSQLLEIRAHSPNLAFDDDVFSIVNNGVGLSKISKEIKNLAATIGSTERKLEGVSEIQGRKIKAGLLTLAGYDGTPDGFYKITQDVKDSKANVLAALNYIYSMLPTNYKVIMKMHSGSEDDSKNLIALYLISQTNDFYKEDVVQVDSKDSLDKVSSNPQLAMIREMGGRPVNYSIITRDSNTKMSVNGTAYPALPKVKEDMSIDKMLSISEFDGIAIKDGITFGDLKIDPSNLKDIMYANSGRNAIVTLPCKIVNGVKQVNLAVRDAYEKAESEAAKMADKNSTKYYKILGEKLKEAHLDSLLDSNGLPDKNMFALFLIVEGYTSDKVPFDNKDSQYIEKVLNPTLDLADRITTALSTDDKKSNYGLDIKDKFALFELTYLDIYRGTVFIPLNNNLNAALSNDKVNIGQAKELEELYLISNKSINYNKNNSY